MAITHTLAKVRTGKAVRISCDFNGGIEQYAKNWLMLTNNAREYPATFLKIYNNSGKTVTVLTTKKQEQSVKEWLEGLPGATVVETEEVGTITPVLDWIIDTNMEVEILPADTED